VIVAARGVVASVRMYLLGTIDEAVAHLARCGVSVDCGPNKGFGAKGWGGSVYFRDPDGTLLKFICYPD
jgi:catechol 2,3-dioxygenase-like lactoylglutathione lyase family enzyme